MFKEILILIAVSLSYGEECGGKNRCTNSTLGVDLGLYICQGKEGDVISVPCGHNSKPNSEMIYTYKNKTADSTILLNSTGFLNVTLTPYDDMSTVITCEVNNDKKTTEPYTYRFSVQYSPRINTAVPAQCPDSPTLHNRYCQSCPLVANPRPECVWNVSWCGNPNDSDNIRKASYFVQNCTIVVPVFDLVFSNICFECIASNCLGVSNVTMRMPLNKTTLCQAEQTILNISSHSGYYLAASNILKVSEGNNLTLSCTVVGVTEQNAGQLHWEFKSKNNILENYDGSNDQYHRENCTLNDELILPDVSLNQSGNYTCVYNELRSKIQVEVIANSVNNTEKSNSSTFIIVGSTSGSTILVLAVLVMFIVILWKLRQTSKWKFTYLYHTDYDDEEEYDVFLSFAEEDRIVAETFIKEPLEHQGYSICWHHDAFLPGYTIEDNIERSIYKSRYTVALISHAFLASQFCLTELSVTKRKSHEISNNTLIPVLVDEDANVPSDLLQITYIYIKDASLLERLKNKLGAPLSIIEQMETEDSFEIS